MAASTAEPASGAPIKFVCPTCWLVFDQGGTRACAGCGIAVPASGWPTLPFKFRDRYHFIEKLGSGGQGVVFRAYDQQAASEPYVAVKVAPPRSDASKEMFRREGRAAAMLSEYPQYFVGFRGSDFNDPAYLVLDFVPWPTLKEMRAAEGNLPPLDVARLGVEILRGVRCMELHSMVHRDLKPENIFAYRCDDGSFEVKIADLGVWVRSGASDESLLGQFDEKNNFGTPPYMSPEHLRGEIVTTASDVYAAAVVLWVLATGAVPFPAKPSTSYEERVADRRRQPGRPPNMPDELYLILTTALRFHPEERVFIDPQTLAGPDNQGNASAARGMEKALRRFVDDYGERRKRSLVEKVARIQALEARLAEGEKRISTAQKLSARADDFRDRLERLNGESTGFEAALDVLNVIEAQIDAWQTSVEDFVDSRRSELEATRRRAEEAERRAEDLAMRLPGKQTAQVARHQARPALARPSIQILVAISLMLIGVGGGYGLSRASVQEAPVRADPPAPSSRPSVPSGAGSAPAGTTTAAAPTEATAATSAVPAASTASTEEAPVASSGTPSQAGSPPASSIATRQEQPSKPASMGSSAASAAPSVPAPPAKPPATAPEKKKTTAPPGTRKAISEDQL